MNQRVLVTGCCGSIGAELTRQLLEVYGAAELIGIDNSESELFFLEQRHAAHSHAHFLLADIRDADAMGRLMRGVDVIFHAAAYKHVVLCERSPWEAVQTNILGVQNIVAAAMEHGVEKVIFTSSDKAVNPTSVMGTSKLMGERLITAANGSLRDAGPVFASTRFGNVLGSRGSVIPIFRGQIARGGPVTLTNERMTRFIMSIEEAVRLVIDSAFLARGGEVFVTKMPVIRIRELAEVMIQELAPQYGFDPAEIAIETIGAKLGEKFYEELMNSEEVRRTIELEKYFVVMPAFRGLYREVDSNYPGVVSAEVSSVYNSETSACLTREDLRAFLIANDLLAEVDRSPLAERFWPNRKTLSE